MDNITLLKTYSNIVLDQLLLFSIVDSMEFLSIGGTDSIKPCNYVAILS